MPRCGLRYTQQASPGTACSAHTPQNSVDHLTPFPFAHTPTFCLTPTLTLFCGVSAAPACATLRGWNGGILKIIVLFESIARIS